MINYTKTMDAADKLIIGSYDVHIHATPALPKRRMSIVQAALQARDAGMSGIGVKDHTFPTVHMARAVSEMIPEVKVMGGIALNRTVGGLNPAAVEACFKLGGRVVYAPSLDSAWMSETMGKGAKMQSLYSKLGVKGNSGGISMLDEQAGGVRSEVKEIIALCKQYGRVFETSHISPEEGLACAEEAKRQGYTKLVVTHPNLSITAYSHAQQAEMIARGATMLYIGAAYCSMPGIPAGDIGELGQLICKFGYKNVVLATDLGHHLYMAPVEGMHVMVTNLLEMEIPDDHINFMIKENPLRLYVE